MSDKYWGFIDMDCGKFVFFILMGWKSEKFYLNLQKNNMMNKVIFRLLSLVLLGLTGCAKVNQGATEETVSVSDFDEHGNLRSEVIENFFREFQEENEDWLKTEEGHEQLIKAFEHEMNSNIDFAKAIASYGTEYQNLSNIRSDESISPYSKEDGEEGEVKAFEFVIPVKLVKPLYNGQKEIDVCYEIISMIPSTVEEHWRPYVKNANFADTFSPYFKSNVDGELNLGCFVVTNK
ncbi:MAG: hypothetical protein NC217_01275 [Muribaculaceae bacterium]|nr:hypothetical protein [Muribaculaceae bacterium]